MQKTGNKTPLIILTAFGDDELKEELLKYGAFDYLSNDELTTESLEQKIIRAVIH